MKYLQLIREVSLLLLLLSKWIIAIAIDAAVGITMRYPNIKGMDQIFGIRKIKNVC